MRSALLVLGLVFVAEFGDKSQLVALTFATRHRVGRVVAGVVLANVVTQSLSVAAGGLAGAALEGPWVSAVAGAVFLVFAAVTLLRGDDEPEDGAAAPVAGAGSVVLAVAGSVLLAELGDKTMFVTMALAAREGIVATWVGSVLGMTAAGLVGIALGRSMADRVPQRALRIGSAALFAAFGAAFLWEALR
jgi:Ca2+/H+ antiporter, TMEM165/GDT1 family